MEAFRVDKGAERFGTMVDLMLTVSYIDGVFHQREWALLHNYVDSVLAMIEGSSIGSPDDRTRLRNAWRSHFEQLYSSSTRKWP